MHLTLKLKTIITAIIMVLYLFFSFCGVNLNFIKNCSKENISILKYSYMIYGDLINVYNNKDLTVSSEKISVYDIVDYNNYINVYLCEKEVYSPISGLVIKKSKDSVLIESNGGNVFNIYNLDSNYLYLYQYISFGQKLGNSTKIDNLYCYSISSSNNESLDELDFWVSYEKI